MGNFLVAHHGGPIRPPPRSAHMVRVHCPLLPPRLVDRDL